MNVNGKSDRGQSRTTDSVTVSGVRVTGHTEGEIMASPVLINPLPKYVAPMTTSAITVIAAIDLRKPGLTDARKHNLLFFAQGHYLATHGTPLFAEPLYATPTGAVVDLAEVVDSTPANNKRLGMLGWVLHRYGDVHAVDLQSLIQISTAWQTARQHDDERIEWAWLTDWFRRPDERNGEGHLNGADLDAAEARLRRQLTA